MPKIKIEALKEGMVVAADVKNMDNMLLIPAGATLSTKQIGILEAWGVTEVGVESGSSPDDNGDPLSSWPPEKAAALVEEIKGLFWRFDESDPVTKEIFRIALHRKARQCRPA